MRRRGLGFILRAAVCLLAFGGKAQAFQSAAPREATWALAHVNVIDATGAATRSNQTVLITGKRIGAVGPSDKIEIPRGAKVVEARDKYLIPGLWDLHVHLYGDTAEVLPVFVANGIIGIRELDTPMPEIHQMRLEDRAGKRLTPRIFAAGKMVEAGEVKAELPKLAPPYIVDYAMRDRVYVNSPEEGREAVRELIELKPDLIKQHVNIKRDIYFAVLDEVHRHGLTMASHYPSGEKVTLKEIADAGHLTIEHLGWPGAADQFNSLPASEQCAVISRLKENRVAFVPTLVTGNGLGNAYFLIEGSDNSAAARMKRAHLDPRARYISPRLWQMWEGLMIAEESYKKPGGLPGFDLPADLALLKRLHQGGVPVLAGTDFTVEFLFPGTSLHEELVELVKQVGLTPYEALQAATRESAEAVGLQDELGTVQKGKLAELVLLDSDPLAEIGNTEHIHAVVHEGHLLDRSALDEAMNRAAPKIQSAGPAMASDSQ